MGTFQPLISIVVPNYNHGSKLQRALDGFFKQTYQNWELILLDDSSTDDSREVMERNAARDPRIRLVFAAQNQGVIKTFNWGLTLIRGDYYLGSAADDFLTSPDFFADAVDAFSTYPDAGVFAGLSLLIKEQELFDPSMTGGIFGFAPQDGIYSGRDSIELYLGKKIDAHGACMIVRSDLAKKMGYDGALGPLADCALYWSIAAIRGLFFRKTVYITVTVSDRNYARSTQLRQHRLFEEKFRTQIPYASEIDDQFINHRLNKIAHLIYIGLTFKGPEMDPFIMDMISKVLAFYPSIVAQQTKKHALISLAGFLRQNLQHPMMVAGIPQLAPLIDYVVRPFYEPNNGEIHESTNDCSPMNRG